MRAPSVPGRLRRAAVALAAALCIALPAGAETLADALADAYRNSNLLEQNRALLRAADEDAAQALAALRPLVSFIASATYVEPVRFGDKLNGTISLQAEITLLDFGAGRLATEAARESVLAVRQGLVSVEQQVLLAAVQAYADVVRAGEFLRLRQSNVRLIGEELRAARDRFEVGEVTRTDVAQAEARLAAARSNLAVAEGNLQIAAAAFRAAVGRAPGRLAGAGRLPALPATLEEAVSVAVRTHPALRQSQHEVRVADLNVERAATLSRGRLTGSAALSMDQYGNDQSSLGLTFRQPIYQGGQISSLYRQALARRDATRANLLEVRVAVERNVAVAWSQLEVAQAALAASERQIAAARAAFEGVQEEATLGARTTLDVLNAEQELLDARTLRVDAEGSRLVAVYSLLSSMGLLTVEHLGLGVPVYDAAAYYEAVKSAPATSVQGERLDRVLRRLGRE